MDYLKSKLIIIYGKAGSYKSTVSKLFLNENNSCYMDIENNKYNLEDITNNLNNNDIVVVDYMELFGIDIYDLIKLKDIVSNTNKTLVMVSCCANSKNLFNEHYYKLKEIADLMILTDKKI